MLSPALNTNWANSALIPAFIIVGTILPERIDHFVTDWGTNIVTTMLTKKTSIINGIPVKPELLTSVENNAVITFPISVYLNIEINVDAKKISTSVFPSESSEWLISKQTSLWLPIVFAPNPYASPNIKNNNVIIKINPELKNELYPNNLSI